MVNQCPMCQKLFVSVTSLKYHISNQVCKNHNNLCSKCHKVFKSKQSYQYHISNNVCEKTQVTPPKPKLVLKKSYNKMTRDELLLLLENAQLKGENKALKENPQNVTNTNNVVVFPHPYGFEDLKHIQQKLGDIIAPLIRNQTFNSIPSLFTTIHSNKQLPEYHNVYLNNEKAKYVMVSDGNRFSFRPKKTIIDQIIEDKRSILNHYIDENGDQLGEKVLAKYERYQNQIDDDSEFRKNLELEIGGLLLDMKAVIANDEKTRLLLDKVTEGEFEIDSATPTP